MVKKWLHKQMQIDKLNCLKIFADEVKAILGTYTRN